MNFFMPDMPNFIKREIEQLQEVTYPLMKKVSKYRIWSLPLVCISILNLFFLLFVIPGNPSIGTLVFYSAIGAVGMALSREAKHHQKEVQKISTDYIIKRIEKSDMTPDNRKYEYIKLVKNHPMRSMSYFIRFLEEENRFA